jgi:ATP-dependent protease ClpP protease subunit
MTTEHPRIRPYPTPVHAPANHKPPHTPAGQWELAIYGDLTDKQSDLIGRLVEVPPKSRGTIFFDSCGGSAYVGLALASLIRLRGLDATAVVVSECSSATLMPLAACTRRYVTPHSTLLFHPIRWQSDEDVRMEEAAEWARHFQLLEKDLDQLLARLFDLPLEKLNEWNRPGRFVSGQEFVDAGLAKMIDLFSGDVWSQMQGEG